MDAQILGTIACGSSLLYMVFGIPTQILKVYRRKSTDGLSLFMTCTLLATTTAWVIYSIPIKNYFIMIANVPGAIAALIILFQFWWYRGRRPIIPD